MYFIQSVQAGFLKKETTTPQLNDKSEKELMVINLHWANHGIAMESKVNLFTIPQETSKSIFQSSWRKER